MGGKVTCTLGEVKQRADFIVYWGGNPAECHPRHFTKYTIMQKSKFLPRGRKDRTMVLVDIRETKSVKAADIFLQVRPGKDFELITILRAMIKGREVGDDQIAETGLSRETIEDLIRRMKAEEIHDSLVHATGLRTAIPIRGTDVYARYATETRSPEDFKGKGAPLKDANFFLESFGQTNREYAERTNEGDITQAILMMNSPFVLRQIQAQPGSFVRNLIERSGSLDDKITALFEQFLVRRPAPEELAMARDVVQSGNGNKGWEDLQWLLVNRVEFVHNY